MRALVAALALALEGCATSGPTAALPDAALYDPVPDATRAVDDALAHAAQRGTRVLIILGANWCHDSRALAGWTQTPRIASLIAERYEPVFIDVAHPQSGAGRNQQVVRRFGLPEMVGTPMVLVLDADGRALNKDSAQAWRNAASRSEAAILEELTRLSI